MIVEMDDMVSPTNNEHGSAAVAATESALMTSHKSARKQQIEVITRGERRRSWSVEQKLEIVAESLEPGMSPIAVARRHGIGTGQLYTWRRQLQEGQSGGIRPRCGAERTTTAGSGGNKRAASSGAGGDAPGRLNGDRAARRGQCMGGCPGRQRSAAAGVGGVGNPMIAPPTGVRVYLACGYTDMRKGAQGLTMLVQQVLAKNPFAEGTVYAFRGRRSNLLKLVWHDGIGLCMLSKRLERGQFIWPTASTGTVMLSAGQLSTLLEGCEWRATARNLRPELAG